MIVFEKLFGAILVASIPNINVVVVVITVVESDTTDNSVPEHKPKPELYCPPSPVLTNSTLLFVPAGTLTVIVAQLVHPPSPCSWKSSSCIVTGSGSYGQFGVKSNPVLAGNAVTIIVIVEGNGFVFTKDKVPAPAVCPNGATSAWRTV